jgi:hypothetical protein
MGKMYLGNERIGNINTNKFGSLMEVVEYKECSDVWVRFLEHGNLVHTAYRFFLSGEVKNPYDRTIFGIGYLGVGEYKATIKSENTSRYNVWKDIFKRCYSEKNLDKQPSYKGCTVAEEWYNFQNFARWYDQNYYEVDGLKSALDKDILIKGNKIYSPETCVFVPQRINQLFVKNDISRGNLPLGVRVSGDRFLAVCKKYLGTFETIDDAFNKYKVYKENYIKEVAEEYKGKIPVKLYNAMITYEVEIDD